MYKVVGCIPRHNPFASTRYSASLLFPSQLWARRQLPSLDEILLMTSNAGAREMASKSIGFGQQAETDVAKRGLATVEKMFSPEFRNRLDALVPFSGLGENVMVRIVDKFVQELEANLKSRRVKIELTDGARKRLAAKGYDPAFGARPMRRIIYHTMPKRIGGKGRVWMHRQRPTI